MLISFLRIGIIIISTIPQLLIVLQGLAVVLQVRQLHLEIVFVQWDRLYVETVGLVKRNLLFHIRNLTLCIIATTFAVIPHPFLLEVVDLAHKQLRKINLELQFRLSSLSVTLVTLS